MKGQEFSGYVLPKDILSKDRRQGHTLSATLEKHCEQNLKRIFTLE